VAEQNPFASEYFFWADAGAGRWTAGVEGQEWPNMHKLSTLRNSMPSEHMLIAQMYSGYQRLQRAWAFDVEAFLWSDKHYIAGTTFGVNKATAPWLANQMHHLLVHEFIEHYHVVNTEQHALFLLWMRHATVFALISGKCPSDVGCRGTYDDFLTIYDALS